MFTPVPWEILRFSHREIELKIVQLGQSDYAATLLEMVKAIDGVLQVRLKPAIPAVVVQYNQRFLSEPDFRAVLLSLVQQAANLRWARAMAAVLLPDFQPVALSPYEFAKVVQIGQWVQRPIAPPARLLDRVEAPLSGVLNRVVPLGAVDDIHRAYDQIVLDWPRLGHRARAAVCSPAAATMLQTGDRSATALHDGLLVTTGIEGGLAGLLEIVGEVSNAALSVLLALITIHRVGEGYGYCPGSDLEKQFAWAVLNVAVAGDPAERQGAIADLHQFQRALYRQTFDDTVDDTLTEGVEKKLVEVVLQRALRRLTEATAEEWVPVVGSAITVSLNLHFLSTILLAAYREFQLRWLLDHQRLSI